MDMLKPAGLIAVFGLWLYAWYRNEERRLSRDYPRREPFGGALENCMIRFPSGETTTDCVLGADEGGIYLASSEEAIERNRWWRLSRRHDVLRTPIYIPWDRLQYGEAKWPLRDHLRFFVPSVESYFFIPRETADRLLARAGRLPPGT